MRHVFKLAMCLVTSALTSALTLALTLALLATHASAEGIRIKVRGSAKLVAHASRDAGDLVLSGALADDAGQPLAFQTIVIRVNRESDPKDAKVAEGLRAARGCERVGGAAPVAYGVRVAGPTDSPDVLVVTDEAGRFCFRAKLVPDRHRAHLAWRGKDLVDGADLDLAFDLSRQALVLRFDPKPRVLSLDEPSQTLVAAALLDDDAQPRAAPGLPLTLSSERGELGKETTDASGRVRFVIASAKLGPPGPGELRVSFAGNADTAFASTTTEIERRVKVVLRVPAAEKNELEAKVPEEGIPLVADVTSSAGPVSEGGVEARIGEVVVGAAPVERGIARLTLTFTAQGNEANVRLRYVPSAPWYEALGETTVRVPIRGPGILSKAPLLVAGLAVVVFFLIGRFSSRQRKPEAEEPKPPEEREAEPHVEVVRAAPKGARGWRGRVVDAHEGNALPSARVWVERGSFEGKRVLESVAADARGEFVLAGNYEIVGDEQLAAEAPLHARHIQNVPPAGEISIGLVLRRRALLARLVAWAKRAGMPYDQRPEPTPGHIRRAAGEDFKTARWADAVERAAFGGGEVDARAEKEIERMAPQAKSEEPLRKERDHDGR
jgi:hypothetical protein